MTIKTPKLKYSDSGFLKIFQNKITIELYNAGVPILTLDIKKKICINKICYNKVKFNSEFLGNSYYNTFLENIILLSPIYGRKNELKKSSGFSQKLVQNGRDIFYEVTKNQAIFRDKDKNVLIKIKKLGF